ncbi:MAG: hypothetical protein QM817_10460 [Archangium sp.]
MHSKQEAASVVPERNVTATEFFGFALDVALFPDFVTETLPWSTAGISLDALISSAEQES